MRAIVIAESFGLENVKLVDRKAPTLLAGHLRVRMLAASLNYRDVLVAKGAYNPRQSLPLIVGSDGVGEVVEARPIGSAEPSIRVGDRVCPIFAQAWLSGQVDASKMRSTLGSPRDGVLTEEMVVPIESVVAVPTHLSDAEAACLPCAGVTAWSALVTHGHLAAGDTVLVQGTGGVSMLALQIAKMFGARVLVTSRSEEKLARAKALGADELIHTPATPNWGKAAKALTGGRGVDHVIEVGGKETLEQSLKAVRPGGTVYVIGVLSGVNPAVNLLPILMQNVRLQGIFVGHRESFEAMNRAIETHQMRPVVGQTFPMSETAEALRIMDVGTHFGKLVIDIKN